MSELMTANPNQVARAIEDIAGELPVMMLGSPGVGKSTTARELAERKDLIFVDIRGTLLQPSDIRGIPIPDLQKETTRWLRTEWLLTEEQIRESGKAGVFYLLDEITNCPNAVQSAFLQFLLDRQVGEFKLPGRWEDGPHKGEQMCWIVGAGNKSTDYTGSGKLIASLADRAVTFSIEVELDEWRNWAASHGVHPLVIGFHASQGGKLLAPEYKAEQAGFAFPTPRSWTYVSTVLKKMQKSPQDVLNLAIHGCVGTGAGTEFIGFMKIESKMPDVRGMLDGSVKIEIPSDMGVLYVMSSALGQYVEEKSISKFFDIIMELPKEFGVMAYKDALTRKITKLLAHEKSRAFNKELTPFLNFE